MISKPRPQTSQVAQAVSIIIPCHNAGAWLGDTLESALSQTWPGCEIVVVDDGATEASLEVARGFEAKGVAVIPQAKKGASAARNTGLRASRGTFIQRIDSDDILSPGKIESQVLRLSSSPANRVASGLWDKRLTLNDDGGYFCPVLPASSGIDFCPDAQSYYRSNLPGSHSRRRLAEVWESAFLSHELRQAPDRLRGQPTDLPRVRRPFREAGIPSLPRLPRLGGSLRKARRRILGVGNPAPRRHAVRAPSAPPRMEGGTRFAKAQSLGFSKALT